MAFHLEQPSSQAAQSRRRARRAGSPAVWRQAFLAAGLLCSLASTASASREMLQNLPLPGDALRLVQPTWEYSPRGPQTLRYHHRYSQNSLASRIATGQGHAAQEMSEGNKGIADSGLSWEQVVALPPEEPFPMGKSEERILNYGMLIHHRLNHPQTPRTREPPRERHESSQPAPASPAKESKAEQAVAADPPQAAEALDGAARVASEPATAADEQPSQQQEQQRIVYRAPGRGARRAQAAAALRRA